MQLLQMFYVFNSIESSRIKMGRSYICFLI